MTSEQSNDDMYVLVTGDDPENITVLDPNNIDETLQAAIDAGITEATDNQIELDNNKYDGTELNDSSSGESKLITDDMREEDMDDKKTLRDANHEIFCVRCEMVFDTKEEMIYHMESMHINRTCVKMNNNEGYLCTECGRQFPNNSLLKEHRLTHTEERPHVCNICDKGFKRTSALLTHIRGVHAPSSDHKCPICDKTFRAKLYLDRHVKLVHYRQHKNYKCNVCQKEFTSISGMSYHRKTHKPRKGLKCPRCSRVYMCKSTLNSHMKMHADGNGYPCRVCGSLFLSIYSLKKHQVIHTRHPTIHCDTCDQDIPTRLYGGHLLKHKEFIPCDHCNEKFQFYPQLVEHERLQHAEVRPFICPTCNKSFRTQKSLIIHERTHAPSYHCDVCPRAFISERFLEKHVERLHLARQQPHTCQICNKSFIRKHHYENHLERHEPWQVALVEHQQQQQKIKEEQLIECLKAETYHASNEVVAQFVTGETEELDSSGNVEEDTNIELTVGQDWIEHPE